MSRKEYRYRQIDLDNDKAIGIQLPFNHRGGLFKLSYTTEEQAISNLKNLILTTKGERFGQPTLGTDINRFLFENNTNDLRVQIENGLGEDIATWLPYIIIDKIDVLIGELDGIDGNVVNIKFNFRVTEKGATKEINILVTSKDGILFV